MADTQTQVVEVSLPSAKSVVLGPGITIQPPLSRLGHGPGLIILTPTTSSKSASGPDYLSPLQKWAEEGFAVVELQVAFVDSTGSVEKSLDVALDALAECPTCDRTNVGLIVFGTDLWYDIARFLPTYPRVVAVVGYGETMFEYDSEGGAPPYLHHLGGDVGEKHQEVKTHTVYRYPQAKHANFAIPDSETFHYSSDSISHSRNLTFLKKHIGGPYFDLEAIWEEHTRYEFAERSVEKTMGTMVQEPYVNHIPTMTGGIGRERLSNFYRHHFVFNNPKDTELELVSRTVGIDRVIDEFIFIFTHNKQIDWLLPGIPPTGRHVRVPFTSVVNVRGDRLYHEHIAWDQASVLVQLGLLPEYLPFPYTLPGRQEPAPGKKFEYRVPAAGADTAKKILDKNSVPSNKMFDYTVREVDA